MATVSTAPVTDMTRPHTHPAEIRVYSHSSLIYWWPVWVVGYILAALTYVDGTTVDFGDTQVVMHPSKNLGVIYTLVTFLVILLTNATVRGLASAMVIVILLAVTFMFAYYGWWEDIFRAIQRLAIYMNLGFYVIFSTGILIIWVLSVFIFDRLDYWSFRPGQAEHHYVFGGGSRTYDVRGMVVYKLRDDLFRHWILGMGSGDMHISTAGANASEFVVPNVMFIGWKLPRVQHLMAMKPDEEAPAPAVTAGEPG